MSTVIVNDSFYPFSLRQMFDVNNGHSMFLEFYSGTMPTKAEIEAADIYKDDGSGWIDPAKWSIYTTSYSLVRRWRLPSFDSNISPVSLTQIRFGFSDLSNSSYEKTADGQNVYNAGQADWFCFRSVTNNGDTIHYVFTGTLSDLAGNGDMKMVRQALSTNDVVLPDSVVVDLGQLQSDTPTPAPAVVYDYYGMLPNSQLVRYDSIDDLWTDTNGTALGTSTAAQNWNGTHSYFTFNGLVYGAINGVLFEANTVQDLWAGNYIRNLGLSPQFTFQDLFFVKDSQIVALNDDTNEWVTFNTPGDFWSYVNIQDTTANTSSWNEFDDIYAGPEGYYVITSGNQLEIFSSYSLLLTSVDPTRDLGVSSEGYTQGGISILIVERST